MFSQYAAFPSSTEEAPYKAVNGGFSLFCPQVLLDWHGWDWVHANCERESRLSLQSTVGLPVVLCTRVHSRDAQSVTHAPAVFT